MATAPIAMADPAKLANASQAFAQVRFWLAAARRFYRGVHTNLEPDLHRITVPALIVAGTDDVQVHWQETLALHRGLPNSKLVLVPHAAYFS